MSGPPVPHQNPAPGSNAIGSFIIGVSPIGDIPFFDYWQTVISQYGNSGVLTQLITNLFQYLDPTVNLQAFFDNIWNVNSAVGYGLDVWGRIVGVIRTVNVPSAGRYFGFAEQGITVDSFNQSPFFSGGSLTNSFQLSDDAFRVLIFAKALANISNGSNPAINQLLLALFPGRGNAFVVDGTPDITTKLLLHFDIPGPQQFLDFSPLATPAVATGSGVIISTAQSIFGGSALFSDGTSYLSYTNSAFNPTGDFTVELWGFATQTPAAIGVAIAKRGLLTGNVTTSYAVAYNSSGQWIFTAQDNFGNSIANGAVIGTAALNTWHHIAVVRSGNNFLLFFDGVLTNTIVSSATLFASVDPVVLGVNTFVANRGFFGYLDEVRFSTKAQWTGNFTLPIAPYSASNPMTMSYNFGFALTTTEIAIITQSGILPKSTGVASSVVQQIL